jgi:hypothetical protein
MQGSLLLIKPLVFRLRYRLSAEEKVIDGGKFGWLCVVVLSELPEFKAPLTELCVLAAVLALTEARGPADLVDTLFLEADWSVIG